MTGEKCGPDDSGIARPPVAVSEGTEKIVLPSKDKHCWVRQKDII